MAMQLLLNTLTCISNQLMDSGVSLDVVKIQHRRMRKAQQFFPQFLPRANKSVQMQAQTGHLSDVFFRAKN